MKNDVRKKKKRRKKSKKDCRKKGTTETEVRVIQTEDQEAEAVMNELKNTPEKGEIQGKETSVDQFQCRGTTEQDKEALRKGETKKEDAALQVPQESETGKRTEDTDVLDHVLDSYVFKDQTKTTHPLKAASNVALTVAGSINKLLPTVNVIIT